MHAAHRTPRKMQPASLSPCTLALAYAAGVVMALVSGAAIAGQPCTEIVPTGLSSAALTPVGTGSFATLAGGPGAPPGLYARGVFTRAGGVDVADLARWDGLSWSAVPDVPQTLGFMMHAADPGDGAALYFADKERTHLHRYDGAAWTTIGLPLFSSLEGRVGAIASFDPDNPGPLGPGLVVGINYPIWTGGTGVVFHFDGQNWTQIADPIGAIVRMIVYDRDRDGPLPPEVYAVTRASIQVGLYKWEDYDRLHMLRDSQWTIISRANWEYAPFRDLYVYDPGPPQLPRLILTGEFYSVGMSGQSVRAGRIAAWDGEAWEGLQGHGFHSAPNAVTSLTTATGERHLVAARPSPKAGLHVWDGQNWSALATDVKGPGQFGPSILGLHEFDDGSGAGPALVASGLFATIDGVHLDNFAIFDGTAWRPRAPKPHGFITALGTFHDGTASQLIVSGGFLRVGDAFAQRMARWDGARWHALPSGLVPTPEVPQPIARAMATFHDGSEWHLYTAGHIGRAGDVHVNNIARWNGSTWSGVGAGLTGGTIWALEVHSEQHTAAPALYAAGNFTNTGSGTPARGIARWDGQQWTEVAGGATGTIYALRSWDDGTGAALYVGGDELSVAGLPSNLAFKLQGSTWHALPAFQGPETSSIKDFVIYASTGSEQLHAVGRFEPRQVWPAVRPLLVRLDGSQWTSLALGGGEARVARSVGCQQKQRLLIGTSSGLFEYTGAPTLARRPLPGQPNDVVHAISPAYHDGYGQALYVGGRLFNVMRLGIDDSRLCYANCDNSTTPPILTVSDLLCFMDEFAAAQILPLHQQITHYANCDGSTTPPILTINDFVCFLDHLALGCP